MVQCSRSRVASPSQQMASQCSRSFFPGGNIGSLAVHGTVNDLAMCGAKPESLTASFILEEGLAMHQLDQIVTSMAAAAQEAGVQVVAGDTKVVEKGKGDGVFISTTGLGKVMAAADVAPTRVRPGDAIVVSGPLGEHGMAVMACRYQLDLGSQLSSDSASVVRPVLALLSGGVDVHCLRDPTRGGLAAALNEIARAAQVGMHVTDALIPVGQSVRDACEFLGVDPLHVASEGRFVAFIPEVQVRTALHVLSRFDVTAGAVQVGSVTAEHASTVLLETGLSTRTLDLLSGEQLPRIC